MTSGIRQWLEALGLSQYAEAFEANDVDMALLPRLNDQVLKDIGVASAGHRLRILGAIETLAQVPGKPGSAADPAADDARQSAAA